MKMTGKKVGIAVEERLVEGGKIKPGTWYGLADEKLRRDVPDRMLLDKETSITLPGKTIWSKVRRMTSYVYGVRIYERIMTGEELMEQAKQAADAIRNGSLKRS